MSGFFSNLGEQFAQFFGLLGPDLLTVFEAIGRGLPYLIVYIAVIVLLMLAWRVVRPYFGSRKDFTSLKTVTFGDESAVVSDKVGSVLSVLLIFVIWASYTGSSLLPSFLHVPGPYIGPAVISYEAKDAAGATDAGTINVIVHPVDEKVDVPPVDEAANTGFAKDVSTEVGTYRSTLVSRNTLLKDVEGGEITSVDGKPIAPGGSVDVATGVVRMTDKGSLAYEPYSGWQMESIWLPSPEMVYERFLRIASEGYSGSSLITHLGYSLMRVLVGFALGAIVGIPLGYAMGLSNWFRGWFDPIVEFMRPVPPLALIPLIIIWFGIGEVGKIILLFLASLWIMAIAARSGVSGVRISKIHAAYSLGATKRQILWNVIMPNSLPEIFTGARVAMGVCWGTVVAAELVAADKGAGMMIVQASKFQLTDIVIMGIILIGVIGFTIDILMRVIEGWLVPWKGKG